MSNKVYIVSDTKGNGNPSRISYGKKAGDGFQYVLKHGVGPGTLPYGTGIIRLVDLSNGYSVAYLDKVLEPHELRQYDIPNEWENNDYIGGVEL